jgi:hypothetical protein
MRMERPLTALAGALLLPVSSAHAGVGCLDSRWFWAPYGVTHAVGSTRASTPCQLSFGERGGIIEALRIVARPSHGTLGAAAPEGSRRYLAYVPANGFVGHDRFELHIQVTPRGGTSMTTRFQVEMDVTP